MAKSTTPPTRENYQRLAYSEADYSTLLGDIDAAFKRLDEEIDEHPTLTHDQRNGLRGQHRIKKEQITVFLSRLNKHMGNLKKVTDAVMTDKNYSDVGRLQKRQELLIDGVKELGDTQLLGNLRAELNSIWGNLRPKEFEPDDKAMAYLVEREIRDNLRPMMASERVKLYLENCENPTEQSLPFFAAAERTVPGLPALLNPTAIKEGRKTRALRQHPYRAYQLRIANQAVESYYTAEGRAFGAIEKGGLRDAWKFQQELEKNKAETQEFANQDI